jgi:MtfA peptidase
MNERVASDLLDITWPEIWENTLVSEVAFYKRLREQDRARLRPAIARFIREKEIVGYGVEVDVRVRLLVAAPACRLALNLPGETYSRLRCVELLPTTFETGADERVLGTGGLYVVSLAFDALVAGLYADDGHNVGYHEFAHVLDASDGIANGVPPLLVNPLLHRIWSPVLSAALERVRTAAEPTGLDSYAGKNEVELFACATEAFFELPGTLREMSPDLYELLAKFYGQDPLKHESQE